MLYAKSHMKLFVYNICMVIQLSQFLGTVWFTFNNAQVCVYKLVYVDVNFVCGMLFFVVVTGTPAREGFW